jgi:hypothetical protein
MVTTGIRFFTEYHVVCRVFFFRHSVKKLFCEGSIKNTRQKKTLGKEAALPSEKKTLGKEAALPSAKKNTRQRSYFAECQKNTRQISFSKHFLKS